LNGRWLAASFFGALQLDDQKSEWLGCV